MKTIVKFDRSLKGYDESISIETNYRQYTFEFETVDELIDIIKKECQSILQLKVYVEVLYVCGHTAFSNEGTCIKISHIEDNRLDDKYL